MIDVEKLAGTIATNPMGCNAAYSAIADWLGDRRRVDRLRQQGRLSSPAYKPDGLRIVLASYGSNPDYPGKVADQYTNREGHGGGLPEGCPPFGKCSWIPPIGSPPNSTQLPAYRCRGRGRAERRRRVDRPRSRHACRRARASAEDCSNRTSAGAKPTKTARSQAKPAKKTASQRAAKAGSSRAPQAAAAGDQHD